MSKINPKLNKEAMNVFMPVLEFCKNNGIKSFNMFLMNNDACFYGHDTDYYSVDDVIFDVEVEDIYAR